MDITNFKAELHAKIDTIVDEALATVSDEDKLTGKMFRLAKLAEKGDLDAVLELAIISGVVDKVSTGKLVLPTDN